MATAVVSIDRATAVARRREAARVRGRRRLAVLASTTAAILAAVAYILLAHSSVFAVHTVSVSGGSPALNAEVQRVAARAAGGHSLLELNPAAVARAVESIPFVRSARVDRAFPNALSISIVREPPVAYVRIGHGGYLIAAGGRVLATAASRPADLPLLQLPDSTPAPVVGRPIAAGEARAALLVMAARPADSHHLLGRLVRVYSSQGMVILRFKTHLQLRMGTPAQAALKWAAAVRDLGRMPPEELAGVAYLDLSGFPRLAIGER